MQVHRTIENLPVFKNAVITIGTFDGVHVGHQKIISALMKKTREVEGESIIISFDPHPRRVLQPDVPLHLINTLDEKIELLSGTGIDHLVIIPFTIDFADQDAEDYISHFLVDKFHPHAIIIGYDHHFGKGRKGNYKLLEEKSPVHNYELVEIPKHVLDEIAVSSTKIRKALESSNVEKANKLLGYEYFFEGTVIQGDKLGRKLGYPTANLDYKNDEKIRLGHGVFAVTVRIDNELKKGMLSIGTRPTLADRSERVEVNIFDFDKEIYGQVIRVFVHNYIRPQEKFDSLDDLIKQMEDDKKRTLQLI